MPSKTLKPCTYPGCQTLVKFGRCVIHKSSEFTYRNNESHYLYKTARWERARIRQLSRQPWCEDCLRQGEYTPATDVDHIQPFNGDVDKFYTNKLQSLCHACHSRKTMKEIHDRQSMGANKVLEVGEAERWGLLREKLFENKESRQ